MLAVPGTCAIAGATLRDLVRRPGFAVGGLALGALLALVPHLGNPAAGIRDNASLALELSLATLFLAGPLVGGLLGVHVVQADHGAGVPPEILAPPASPAAVCAGRWLGAWAATLLVGLAASVLGLIGWIPRAAPTGCGGAAEAALLAVAWVTAVALGASLGMVYGSGLARDLARVVLILHLVAARWVGIGPGGADWRAFLPDPSRLDLAREFAFGTPVSGAAAAGAAGAALLQSLALLLLGSALVRARLRAGRA